MSVQSVIEGKISFAPLGIKLSDILSPEDPEYDLWPGTTPRRYQSWLKFTLDEQGRPNGLECNPIYDEWGRRAHSGIGLLREFVALHPEIDYTGDLTYLDDGGTNPPILAYRFTVLPSPTGTKWVYLTRPASGGTTTFYVSGGGAHLTPTGWDKDWPDPATTGLALEPLNGTRPLYETSATERERRTGQSARYIADLAAWQRFERRSTDGDWLLR